MNLLLGLLGARDGDEIVSLRQNPSWRQLTSWSDTLLLGDFPSKSVSFAHEKD
jgi:hypothetical protein